MTSEDTTPSTQDRSDSATSEAAGRMSGPWGLDVAQAVADQEGVCVRPIAMRRIDGDTEASRVVGVACGATREAVCGPCARRNRRLRADQCREGWHRETEPEQGRDEPDAEQKALMGYRADLISMGRAAQQEGDENTLDDVREAVSEVDEGLRAAGVRGRLASLDEPQRRRVRSTRRRADVPDLPRKPVQRHTVGQVYAGRYRPSLFVTLTLGSYGPVHSARRRHGRVQPCRCGAQHEPDAAILGAPVAPESYDYRRAARDAIHFPGLVDRFWQNLRRAAGWNVQYFAAVEAQRRLAPHLHTAIRGSIPRALLRQVAQATYHQVWSPPHGDPLYTGEHMPVWVPEKQAFCDPDTRQPLPTFDEHVPGPEADSGQAAHVVRFGDQVDIRGVLGGSEEATRHVGYLTKYLTKSVGETYTDASNAHRAHADRLLAELVITPCSPECPIWLIHGIQPRKARSTLTPGRCRGKAHRRATLGVAGRRVLVSRAWSGKTVRQHASDRQNHVRQVLSDGGITPETTSQSSEPGRTHWEKVAPGDTDVPPRPWLLLEAVATRRRWRHQYQHAHHQAPS